MVQLSAGGGLSYSILSEFTWKETTTALSAPTDYTQPSRNGDSSQLIGQFNIEITLSKRVPNWAKMLRKSDIVNGGSLEDEAFLPKSFGVRIEQGHFAVPCEDRCSTPGSKVARDYTRRLVFDRAPYPPTSEWKDDMKNMWYVEEGQVGLTDANEFVSYSP